MTNPTGSFKHLFGPVDSRRLGRSLGVDLTPAKTCSYDCIYCQLGRTASLTSERREWVATQEVVEEIRRWASCGGQADTITLAGSGEPTLHTDFGRVLAAAHEFTGLPAALLTNGSLLYLPDVRRQAALASIVKVTLSAADAPTWRRLHRPADDLRFEDYLEGLRLFADARGDQLWLEIMLVRGVNDSPEHLGALAAIAGELRPDRVQLNTVVRPPAESEVIALDGVALENAARLFPMDVEVVTRSKHAPSNLGKLDRQTVQSLVSRHPASADQIARQFDATEDEVKSLLKRLVEEGTLEVWDAQDVTYYRAPSHGT